MISEIANNCICVMSTRVNRKKLKQKELIDACKMKTN